MKQLQAANAYQLQKIDDKLTYVLDQFIVGSADTTLSRWEKELDLPDGSAKPIEQRRSVIIAKLRGAGTTTVQMLKNTALAYENGDVEIIEDAPNNQIKIKFVGVKGVPPNLNDFENIMDDIIPAHLSWNYVFTYMTWDEHDAYNKTWGAWDILNLTWNDFETYKE